MDKSKLEELLGVMVSSGIDMTEYRRSPTKLVISPYLLKVAEQLARSNLDNHEIKVDFNE